MATSDTKKYFLDDLTVGQCITSGTHALDEAQIFAFARQFDPQPFHLDPEAAKATLFGGLAASGWHTAAITMRLMTEGGSPFVGGMVGLEVDLRWPTPTRPQDILRVVSEVLEIRPSRSKPDRGVVKVRSVTLNQHDEVRQSLVSKLMVPRRPAA